jgi:hypothetical protein
MHDAASGSVGLLVAREVGVPHLYCDPPAEIRTRLRIESAAERERYWLGQLKAFRWYPCLFILVRLLLPVFQICYRSRGLLQPSCLRIGYRQHPLTTRDVFAFACTRQLPQYDPSCTGGVWIGAERYGK